MQAGVDQVVTKLCCKLFKSAPAATSQAAEPS